MNILNTVLDLTKYEYIYGQRLLSILKTQHKRFYLDYEINQLKDYKIIDEYAMLIKEALLLDVTNEKGNGTILLDSRRKLVSNRIEYTYFELENNYFLYYIRFIPLLMYSYNVDELIVLLNTNGKYICVDQENNYFYISTNEFKFSEMNAETSEFFNTCNNINELEKNTLLKKALDVFQSKVNSFWYDEEEKKTGKIK